jgi:hypothetical protein
MSNINKLIVNTYGGPGSGKSTAAASIYATLKRHHIDCELVTDFAKDMIIQGNTSAMNNQLYVWASQLYRNQCAYDRATVTISDTPILLGCIYNKDKTNFLSPNLELVIFEQYRKMNNFNLMVPRNMDVEYSMFGRIHTEQQSIQIDQDIVELLTDNDIPFTYYSDDDLDDICASILQIVK